MFEMLELRKSKSKPKEESPASPGSMKAARPASPVAPSSPPTSAVVSPAADGTPGTPTDDPITGGIMVGNHSDDEDWGLAGYLDKYFSYSVEVSMLEIYNEQVYDLLVPPNEAHTHNLEIKQSPEGGVNVPGLKQVVVKSLQDVMEVFSKGSANRATASTCMNEHSSRSHLILIVHVTTVLGDGPPMKGKLHLVDLAGAFIT